MEYIFTKNVGAANATLTQAQGRLFTESSIQEEVAMSSLDEGKITISDESAAAIIQAQPGVTRKEWTQPELERVADMTGVHGQPGLILDGMINISQPSL